METSVESHERGVGMELITNSKQWWEAEFSSGAWETGIDGKLQTEYFMKLLLGNLPEEVLFYLHQNITILDWGCALGQGVNLLSLLFPEAKVSGLDFSEVAVAKAKELYPHLHFRSLPLGEGDFYDVIVTSNVLEHYYEPFKLVEEHLNCCGKYYIILVPYNQPPQDHHFFKFAEDSFPLKIGEFTRYYSKVIPSLGNPLWDAEQILAVYKRR